MPPARTTGGFWRQTCMIRRIANPEDVDTKTRPRERGGASTERPQTNWSGPGGNESADPARQVVTREFTKHSSTTSVRYHVTNVHSLRVDDDEAGSINLKNTKRVPGILTLC
ncbi:hypothetical protein T4E_10531 [Trichinella pseudospiralis]|uniref:Uncharacterized protein n=1 Tax=Trichinella pseudospiralis TaxID=6337 RepID=A0A0V0XUY1_TRIPS|nr:hypothetical protein T4E_10531 [Trichinella pseudospiralis]